MISPCHNLPMKSHHSLNFQFPPMDYKQRMSHCFSGLKCGFPLDQLHILNCNSSLLLNKLISLEKYMDICLKSTAITCKVGILVSSGYQNKIPQIEWLINKNVFLTVWELGSLRLKGQTFQLPSDCLLLGLQTLPSLCFLTW